jgi:hypothetical protein
MSSTSKVSLVVGIDSYQNRDLEPLVSCKKDAKDINALLTELGYVGWQHSPLIGSEILSATSKLRVREIICDFFESAKPDQNLIFYFSGHGIHGGNDIFLGTPEIDPEKPRISGFSLSDLTKCMEESGCSQIVGIIDACYSGGVNLPDASIKSKSERAKDSAKEAWRKYNSTVAARGVALLLSGHSYEKSYALEGKNSVYTQHLLDGLQGVKSAAGIVGSIDMLGNITPQSLHNYVYIRVASKYQKPVIKILESNQIIIVDSSQLKKRMMNEASSNPDYQYLKLSGSKNKQNSFLNKILTKAWGRHDAFSSMDLIETISMFYMIIDRYVKETKRELAAYYVPPYPRDIYLPAHLKRLKEEVVFLSDVPNEYAPSLEELTRGKLFVENPKGLLVTPPGHCLLTRIERELRVSFGKKSLEKVCKIVPQFLVDFGLAKKAFARFDASQEQVRMLVDGSVFTKLYTESQLESVYLLGCPIASAFACAISQSAGKIVEIHSIRNQENGFLITYRIVTPQDRASST